MSYTLLFIAFWFTIKGGVAMSETLTVEQHNNCVTHYSSSSSGNLKNKTVTISVRIPSWLYKRFKEKGVSNISSFVRKLLLMEVETDLTREEELEAQLENLKSEMEKLQHHHTTLLKHGSYAKDYLEKLKDGNIVTHKPFRYSKPSNPTLSKEELELVDETVKLRERLSKQYREKLSMLLKLKDKKFGD